MMDAPGRLNIPYPVIVEGKYDKLRLCSVIEAKIITTDGFGIFKNTEKQAFLRVLASKTPVIVLTDPDGAGQVIRSKICGILPKDRVIRLYVPRVEGKEKRKALPSAEGVLGVEGTDTEIIYNLFKPFSSAEGTFCKSEITAGDLYSDGLTGQRDSMSKRDAFCESLGLPPGMSAKAFLTAINFIITREEYLKIVGGLFA